MMFCLRVPRLARRALLVIALLVPAGASLLGCAATAAVAPASPAGWAQREQPFVTRKLVLEVDGQWIGNGIAYGMHRDGQHPDHLQPTREELRQDLALIARRWHLIRMYNSSATAEAVLEVIRADHLPIKVMLGAWIAPEPSPEAAARNRAEVDGTVRLANAFPEVAIAAIVGNESQIGWSDHRVPPEVLIRALREVRAHTRIPVTTADDFAYWASRDSAWVAAECDFLDVHAYAMWNGKPLEQALGFTRDKLAEVARRHPGRTLLLGEFGWATRRHSEGDQARLIKGAAGEAEQAQFFEQALAWTSRERIPNLWFEAFDENWKGGPHPDEVEKHWGLYRADRTPKQAIQRAARP